MLKVSGNKVVTTKTIIMNNLEEAIVDLSDCGWPMKITVKFNDAASDGQSLLTGDPLNYNITLGGWTKELGTCFPNPVPIAERPGRKLLVMAFNLRVGNMNRLDLQFAEAEAAK